MSRGLGKTQQKILLLLLGGLSLGLSRSPKNSFKILKAMAHDWQEIDRYHLKRAIESLYKSKMIKEKYGKDGSITIVISDEGKKKALAYELSNIKIKKPKKWDGKWRIVMFDIPEKRKKDREGLRYHLKDQGFFEFQKSVFVHPFDCKDEIDFIIEFYKIRKFVRFVVADSLDNEIHLKKHFNLA